MLPNPRNGNIIWCQEMIFLGFVFPIISIAIICIYSLASFWHMRFLCYLSNDPINFCVSLCILSLIPLLPPHSHLIILFHTHPKLPTLDPFPREIYLYALVPYSIPNICVNVTHIPYLLFCWGTYRMFQISGLWE